jgi:hypothetical protein
MRQLIIAIIFTTIVAFRPQPQLYGEWTMWHSHNPSFKGSNRMLVGLYPESNIEVSYREYTGPWMIETRKIGTFHFDNDLRYDDNDNKMKTDFDPICKSNVCVEYKQKEKRVLSFLGIGFDDISPLQVESHNVTLHMKLYIVDRNDLFLTMNQNDHYHLMRSIRVNEPTINVPISTLIATNIVGMMMTAIIQHHYLSN